MLVQAVADAVATESEAETWLGSHELVVLGGVPVASQVQQDLDSIARSGRDRELRENSARI